jgi:hypothetical protein
VTAAVILFTGAGVSAVFWKMPTSAEFYDLYQPDVVDKELAGVPLPNEAVAAISSEEMKQISLPALEIAPVIDDGAKKYAQAYEPPASLAATHAAKDNSPAVEAESPVEPASPKKFEPMRRVVEKKPIDVETINDVFLPKPESVSTAEKSDELLATFQFAENGKADFASAADMELPADPFPVTTAAPTQLQPLQPLTSSGLSPLLPL